MNCKKCSNKYDSSTMRPYLITPCCHIVCESCMKSSVDTKCPECSELIQDSQLSQDLLTIIEQNKRSRIKSHQKLKQLEELNQVLEQNYQFKKDTTKISLIQLQQQVETKAEQIIAKINDEKKSSLDLVKAIEHDLNSKLNKIIQEEHEILIKLNDIASNSDYLTSIEQAIYSNLNKLNKIDFNQIFIQNNTEINYIGEIVENIEIDLNPTKRQEIDYKREIILDEHENTINCLIQLPKNKLASGSADCRIIIWNTFDWSKNITLWGHKSLIWCLALIQYENKQGSVLASGSSDETIIIWNYETGRQLNILRGHEKRINFLVVLPNSTMASCSEDSTIRIWNVDEGKSLKCLKGHESTVYCLVVFKNCLLASSDWDGEIIIWYE